MPNVPPALWQVAFSTGLWYWRSFTASQPHSSVAAGLLRHGFDMVSTAMLSFCQGID